MDTEVDQTEVYVSLIRLRAEDQNEDVRFTEQKKKGSVHIKVRRFQFWLIYLS